MCFIFLDSIKYRTTDAMIFLNGNLKHAKQKSSIDFYNNFPISKIIMYNKNIYYAAQWQYRDWKNSKL